MTVPSRPLSSVGSTVDSGPLPARPGCHLVLLWLQTVRPCAPCGSHFLLTQAWTEGAPHIGDHSPPSQREEKPRQFVSCRQVVGTHTGLVLRSTVGTSTGCPQQVDTCPGLQGSQWALSSQRPPSCQSRKRVGTAYSLKTASPPAACDRDGCHQPPWFHPASDRTGCVRPAGPVC